MILSDIGKIALHEWKQISILRSYMTLGAYVIMPDHIHGIININNDGADDHKDVLPDKEAVPDVCKDVLPKRLYTGPHPKMSQISPDKKSISTAIRFFKRQTSIQAKKIDPDFTWLPRLL